MEEAEEAMVSLHFLSTFSLIRTQEKQKRKHRFWVRKIFQDRDKYGIHSTLIRDLRSVDQEFYFE
jgi:hypothetical protein